MQLPTFLLLSSLLAPTLSIPSPSHSHSHSHWTRLPSLTTPRQEHSVTSLGTSIYIVGGTTTFDPTQAGLASLSLTQAYSLHTKKWRTLAPLPTPINHGNIAAHSGKLYLLGGLTGFSDWAAVGASYAYCPATDAWSTLPSMPAGTERGAAAVGVWREWILLAGGLSDLNLLTGSQPSVGTVSRFNTRTGEWRGMPGLPEGRDHVGGAVVGDTFFVVGGRVNGTTGVRGTVFAMDLGGPEEGWGWVERRRMITPRGGLAASVVGERIYTFGGEGDSEKVPNGVYDQVEVYDTVRDEWWSEGVMEWPRHGTNAASLGGKIYIPGGGNVTQAAAVNYFDAFTP